MATANKPLTGHWKKQFDYEHLGAYSLADSDDEAKANYTPINVTIKKLGRKTVKTERGAEDCFVCWFEEKIGGENKPMILNKTNSKIMEELYSANIKHWIDKKVQLYVDLKIRAQGGEITKGLRFRDVKTPLPKPKEKPELTPKHPKWDGAKKSVQEGTITFEGLQKHFKITKANFTLLKKAK